MTSTTLPDSGRVNLTSSVPLCTPSGYAAYERCGGIVFIEVDFQFRLHLKLALKLPVAVGWTRPTPEETRRSASSMSGRDASGCSGMCGLTMPVGSNDVAMD